MDAPRQRVLISTRDGLWVFEAPAGRQAGSYLDTGRWRKHHKLYRGPIAFTDLLLLVYFADLFDHARMTSEEDYRYIEAVKTTIIAPNARPR